MSIKSAKTLDAHDYLFVTFSLVCAMNKLIFPWSETLQDHFQQELI